MYSVFIFLIYFICRSNGYGYDSGTDQGACGKPYRSSRMHQPPCDLAHQTYCTTAGKTYPWHAVRRFIRENQGLMRRMYGDERHIAVLKAELETNDLNEELENPDDDLYSNGDVKTRYAKHGHDFDNDIYEDRDDEARYLQDRKDEIIMNTKFVYSQDPTMQIKLKDLQPPRFRPTTQKPVENTEARILNKTVEVVFENVTEVFYEAEEGNTTETADVEVTTTEEGGDETTTEELQESTTTTTPTTNSQTLKKEPSGEVLFQDLENNKPVQNMNLKLRGVNACPVKEEVVAPFWANNTRGEVLALLNLYPFEQYVHWEKCTFEHRQMYCREGCRCEQQYRLHRLLAYDPNNECRGIFSDWFKFPSCCVCKCYDMTAEFRVTSRSPRSKDEKTMPSWFKKKNKKGFNKD